MNGYTAIEQYRGDGAGFSPGQIDLVRRTIAKGANDDELALFVAQCERTRLDPFSRQIYALKQWDKQAGREVMRIQLSIDGLRLIAERTGKYAGQLGPFWCGSGGTWLDVWLSDTPPNAAKVAVIRSDFAEPLWAVARYGAYVQTTRDGSPNSMWQKMADNQLAKCAESLALRKAFPQDLSGLYTSEEMGQASNETVPTPAPAQQAQHVVSPAPTPSPPSTTTRRRPPPSSANTGELIDAKRAQQLHADAGRQGIGDDDFDLVVLDVTGGRTSSAAELTAVEANRVTMRVRDCVQAPETLEGIRAAAAEFLARQSPVPADAPSSLPSQSPDYSADEEPF